MLVKVRDTGSTSSLAGIKNALVTYRVLQLQILQSIKILDLIMAVYMNNMQGEGGRWFHAVTLIGYNNDDPRYWICKNSWGERVKMGF